MTIQTVISLGCLVVITGCQSPIALERNTSSSQEKKAYMVKILGTPGLEFGGKISTEDGSTEFSGTVPAELSVEASTIACTFSKDSGKMQLSLEIWDGNYLVGSATASGFSRTVHGEISNPGPMFTAYR